jgi:hypothetical protein
MLATNVPTGTSSLIETIEQTHNLMTTNTSNPCIGKTIATSLDYGFLSLEENIKRTAPSPARNQNVSAI